MTQEEYVQELETLLRLFYESNVIDVEIEFEKLKSFYIDNKCIDSNSEENK